MLHPHRLVLYLSFIQILLRLSSLLYSNLYILLKEDLLNEKYMTWTLGTEVCINTREIDVISLIHFNRYYH